MNYDFRDNWKPGLKESQDKFYEELCLDTFRFLHVNTKSLTINGPFDGWQCLLKDKRDEVLKKFNAISKLKICSKISDGTLCNDDFDIN